MPQTRVTSFFHVRLLTLSSSWTKLTGWRWRIAEMDESVTYCQNRLPRWRSSSYQVQHLKLLMTLNTKTSLWNWWTHWWVHPRTRTWLTNHCFFQSEDVFSITGHGVPLDVSTVVRVNESKSLVSKELKKLLLQYVPSSNLKVLPNNME